MNEIRELVNKLNSASDAYNKGEPFMSDAEWDKMYFELKEKERVLGFCYPDSPTQIIKYSSVSTLQKVEHNHLMLSLDKTKDIKEVTTFLQDKEWLAMFKMDGLTCSLTYKNGILVRAETRGNGESGEDILHNAKVIASIPQRIPVTGVVTVDGEIICTKSDFNSFIAEYKNPRNFAAGSIRLLYNRETSERKLTFVAWDLISGSPEDNFIERLEQMRKWGFLIVPYTIADSVKDAIDKLDNAPEQTEYPIDGYVFKFISKEYGESLGQTGHHFRNALAYKFYDETYSTTLKDIEWTMGKTGVLTPVAIFEPIEIDGAIIERASMHNVSVMHETLGECPYVEEPLEIYRANMIIPQIKMAGPKYNAKEVFGFHKVAANYHPEKCPICGGATEVRSDCSDTQNLYCTNLKCAGQLVNRIDHFCGNDGLNIKGLSKATLEKLIRWGWIKTFSDVLLLHKYKDKLKKKPGFGEASVMKLLTSIYDATHPVEMWRVISAASIPQIGASTAKILEKKFKTYKDFRHAIDTKFNFLTLPDFGEVTAYELLHFDYSEIDDIIQYIEFKEKKKVVSSEVNTAHTLATKRFVITGTLQFHKNREELKTKIEDAGGKVAATISGRTSYLVCNNINGISQKIKEAQAKGIPIISEQELLDMIEGKVLTS